MDIKQEELGDMVEKEMASTSAAIEDAVRRIEVRTKPWNGPLRQQTFNFSPSPFSPPAAPLAAAWCPTSPFPCPNRT